MALFLLQTDVTEDEDTTTIEYLDRQGLRKFLFDREKLPLTQMARRSKPCCSRYRRKRRHFVLHCRRCVRQICKVV